MKKIKLMAIVMLLMIAGLSSTLSATRPVSYVHKLMDLEGCRMSFSVTQLDTIYYIVVCAESDRLCFIDEPKMKMQTASGEVLTMFGFPLNGYEDSFLIHTGYFSIPFHANHSMAVFEATPQQFELMKVGITRVKITMLPYVHDHTFKKDKIGQPLYEQYLEIKAHDF